MKKIIYFACGIIAVAVISSCKKEFAPVSHQDGDLVLVNLNLTGEVTVDETPLTRTLTSDDLIGIQVFQGSDYYAHGLFDDASKIYLYLHSGKKYSFKCLLIKDGKNILPIQSDGYDYPFRRNSGTARVKPDNLFIYTSKSYFPYLQTGAYALTAYSSYRTSYPQAISFYGELLDAVGEVDSQLSLYLKRVAFGVSLSVNGITDGNVEVIIKNSERTFLNKSGIAQDTQFSTSFWTFYDLKSAWQYADNYTENFTVGVVWNRGVGVKQDLGTKVVQFKRNVVNNVIINLSSTTGSSGLAVSLEEPELTSESFMFGN